MLPRLNYMFSHCSSLDLFYFSIDFSLCQKLHLLHRTETEGYLLSESKELCLYYVTFWHLEIVRNFRWWIVMDTFSINHCTCKMCLMLPPVSVLYPRCLNVSSLCISISIYKKNKTTCLVNLWILDGLIIEQKRTLFKFVHT